MRARRVGLMPDPCDYCGGSVLASLDQDGDIEQACASCGRAPRDQRVARRRAAEANERDDELPEGRQLVARPRTVDRSCSDDLPD